MNKNSGFSWGWLVVGLLVAMLMRSLFFGNGGGEVVALKDYNEFLRMLDQGKFVSVQVTPNDDGTLAVVAAEKIEKKDEKEKVNVEEKKYTITAPVNSKLVDKLTSKPEIELITARQPSNWFGTVLSWVLPVLLFFVIWSFLMKRQMGGGGIGGPIMGFGKSRAKLLQPNDARVTFDDVAGAEEAKEDLREVIEFLKDPRKFTKLGGRLPKGCLLIGQPGTGKTLLASAVAGEASVPFFSITGSGFVEMFVGVGASRVRDMFAEAKKQAPCIIFIDELDAVGKSRGGSVLSGNDEREQTLNQLLAEMDGFETDQGVIILAATNRPEVLDSALLRPGRFDLHVIVPLPDVKGREAILKVHARKMPLEEGVDLSVFARGTPGFSGADLANMLNEAALSAARHKREVVTSPDLELAKDKVSMGSERKFLVMSPEEKRTIAYHEAGHALVAKFTKGADPVHKVSIIPRGMSLGVTQQLPIEDKQTHTNIYLEGQLAILFGGRTAEAIFLNQKSTGAANDIDKASEIAQRMVQEWGMSDEVGPIKWGGEFRHQFLGTQIPERIKNYSEETARKIDEEVRRLIAEACSRAENIIKTHKREVEAVAEKLLEKETLDGAEIDALIKSGS